MKETIGYAAHAPNTPLEPFTFNRRDVTEHDVAIEILFCGICHSDLHQINNDWGFSQYPMVPGHEIVGRVTKVGTKVSKFSVGDTVGVGCLVDACHECTPCKSHEEQFCEAGNTQTYNSPDKHTGGLTYGGYSKEIVVTEAFVLRVAPSLDLAQAAPLLCAGITTYSPLKRAQLDTNSHVGIIGLGGLGHMAVKIAHAMDARITVFTTHSSKIEAAKALGVDDVVVSTDTQTMTAHAGQYDFILNTVSATIDLAPYLNLLKHDGQFTQVGLPTEPASVSMFPLVFKRLNLSGSLIGGIQETQEMLDFCAKHHISADIEKITMQDINTALERLAKGEVSRRFVIDMQA